jgi:hypothetical protein
MLKTRTLETTRPARPARTTREIKIVPRFVQEQTLREDQNIEVAYRLAFVYSLLREDEVPKFIDSEIDRVFPKE